MRYSDVASGIVVHAGDTVSVFVVLEDTVRVWPAPVPAVILTTSPAHWLAVHALGPVLVVSWSVVLVCPMTYWDVPSGVVVHAGGEMGRVVVVLEDTVREWAAAVAAVIVTRRPAQRLLVHIVVVWWSVVVGW